MLVGTIVFLISLLPLNILAGGNRSLVMLPFFVLISSLFLNKLFVTKKYKSLLLIFLFSIIVSQLFESFIWIQMRMVKSPQEVSSEWLIDNIPKGTVIGIENVPIYQGIPDIIQKEFYYNQYGIKSSNNYKYELVDSKTRKLPPVLVITNGEIDSKVFKTSSKRDLIKRLEAANYKKIAVIEPDLTLFRLVGNNTDYYFSWLLSSPLTTSVYIKQQD